MDTYFIPVVCASLSSIARGLTQYGDAIIFHVCSASFQIVIQSSPEVANIQFSVLCTAIMSITSLPLSIYLARSHILSTLPYGFSLSVTGLLFLPLGTYALFLGNIQILEIFIGIFFMLFAMFRLTSVILQKSKNAPDTTIPDITTTTTKDPVTDINDGTDLIVNYPISSSSGLLHQIFQWIDSKVIQISTTYSPSFSLLIFTRNYSCFVCKYLFLISRMNPVLNPILYATTNSMFRNAYAKIFSFLFYKIKHKELVIENEMLEIN